MTAANVEAPAVVDVLLHPRWVVPMSGSSEVLTHHSIALSGNRIVAVGPTAELTARFRANRAYRLDTHAVMPGLINAHGHAPMSLLRGYADDLPLQTWLEHSIWPAETRVLSESYVADGARLAIAEMLLGGTTCFTDMYFFPDQVAAAATDAGIRAHMACPVFDFASAWARDADEYIAKATRLHDQYRNSELVRIAFGPHAPYTVSDAPLRKIAMLADELDVSIHIHLHENAQEVGDALRTTGKRPLERLKQLDLLSPRLQCVHMTQIADDELPLLAAHGVHVVHCPSSNLKLASGFCRTRDLLAAGVNVALGTDGSASNNRLDMFGELRLAALLAKGVSGDASAIPAITALRMATLHGARALGIEEHTGSIEGGKLADLIAVNLDHPNTQPVFDPVSTLAYSAQASQVSHVWVHGQLLRCGRRPYTHGPATSACGCAALGTTDRRRRQHMSAHTPSGNIDAAEIAKFEKLASRWWDRNSEFKPLHDINPLRCGFIDSKVQLVGKQVLDVGCGGGILSEALAQRGAQVTGIDMGEAPLAVARLHLLESKVDVHYEMAEASAYAERYPERFDVVTCLEMLEHVPDPAAIILSCFTLLKPGGDLFVSTINRNPKSWLFAVVGAEYILRMLPRGTHDYAKFIKPSELAAWARQAGFMQGELTGMSYNPLTRHYSLGQDVDVNYLMHLRKPEESNT